MIAASIRDLILLGLIAVAIVLFISAYIQQRADFREFRRRAGIPVSPAQLNHDIRRYARDLANRVNELPELKAIFDAFSINEHQWSFRPTIKTLFVTDLKLRRTGRSRSGAIDKEPLKLMNFIMAGELGNVILLGRGGIGKSCVMRYLAAQLADVCSRGKIPAHVPILVNLPSLNRLILAEHSDVDTLALLYRASAVSLNNHMVANEFAQLADDGRLTFLLDSFDDIAEEADRHAVSEAIAEVVLQIDDRNRFVIASRKAAFQTSETGHFMRWPRIELEGLTDSGAVTLLNTVASGVNVPIGKLPVVPAVIRTGNPFIITLLPLLAWRGQSSAWSSQYDTFSKICEVMLQSVVPGEYLQWVWTFLEKLSIAIGPMAHADGLSEDLALNLLFGLKGAPGLDQIAIESMPERTRALEGRRILHDISLIQQVGGRYRFIYPAFQDYFVARSLASRYPNDGAAVAKYVEFWSAIYSEYTRDADRHQILVFLAEATRPDAREQIFDDFERLVESQTLSSDITWPTMFAVFEGSPTLREKIVRVIVGRVTDLDRWGRSIQEYFGTYQRFLTVFLKLCRTSELAGPQAALVAGEIEDALLNLVSEASLPNWHELFTPRQAPISDAGVPVRLLARAVLIDSASYGRAAVSGDPSLRLASEIVKASSGRIPEGVTITISGEDEGPLRALKQLIQEGVLKRLMEKDAKMAERGWPRVRIRVLDEPPFIVPKPFGGLVEKVISGEITLMLQPHRFLGLLAHSGAIRPIEVPKEERNKFSRFEEFCSYGLYDYGYPFSALSMYFCCRPDLLAPEIQGKFTPPLSMADLYNLAAKTDQSFKMDGSKKRRYATGLSLNPGHHALWHEWLNFVYAAGGNVIQSEPGREYGDIVLNKRPTVDGTLDYLSLSRFASPDCGKYIWDDMKQLLFDDSVFMTLVWTDQVYDLHKKLDRRARYFPVPGTLANQLESWFFCVPTPSPQPELALEFARWFSTSIEVQTEYFCRGGCPALDSFYDDAAVAGLVDKFPYLAVSKEVLHRPGVRKETIPEADRITHAIMNGFERLTQRGMFDPAQGDRVGNDRVMIEEEFDDLARRIAFITGERARYLPLVSSGS